MIPCIYAYVRALGILRTSNLKTIIGYNYEKGKKYVIEDVWYNLYDLFLETWMMKLFMKRILMKLNVWIDGLPIIEMYCDIEIMKAWFENLD